MYAFLGGLIHGSQVDLSVDQPEVAIGMVCRIVDEDEVSLTAAKRYRDLASPSEIPVAPDIAVDHEEGDVAEQG